MNNHIYENWENIFIRIFGMKVRDYRTNREWRDLSFILNDLKLIMVMLNSIILNNQKYELIWEGNPNGCYSVASRYNSL